MAELVEPFGLRARDVAGRGIAFRVDVGVVPDERVPVLVARSFDRFSNVLPVEAIRATLAGPDAGGLRAVSGEAGNDRS